MNKEINLSNELDQRINIIEKVTSQKQKEHGEKIENLIELSSQKASLKSQIENCEANFTRRLKFEKIVQFFLIFLLNFNFKEK